MPKNVQKIWKIIAKINCTGKYKRYKEKISKAEEWAKSKWKIRLFSRHVTIHLLDDANRITVNWYATIQIECIEIAWEIHWAKERKWSEIASKHQSTHNELFTTHHSPYI